MTGVTVATASVDDNRTVQNDADSTTNWTNVDATNTTTYAESTASNTSAVDTTNLDIYHTGTSRSLSTFPLVYVWSTNIADQGVWLPGTLADAPHGLLLGDGTNTIVCLNAGNDREVFKHSETQTTFQCLLIDEAYLATKDTAGEIYELAGTYASFVETSVELFGAYFTTLAKAFKGWNCGVDVIRIGGYGDYVNFYAGTSGDPITFEDCAVEDRSTADARGLGIIRTYTADTFGCQGRLGIGFTSATWFEQDGFVLVFEDRDVSDNAFGLQFNHATVATPFTEIILKNGSISSAGPGVEIEDAGTERLELTIESVAFNNLLNTISFPSNYYSGAGSITSCSFNGCGQIDPGPATFEGNVISNTTTAAASGAVLLDASGTSLWDGNEWIYAGGATEAAIYVSVAGSYTFTNLVFTGYGATASNTASVFNDSGGLVTITNSGSTGITYRNGTSATTTIIDAITVTFTGIVADTEIRVYETGTNVEEDGIESVIGTSWAATLQGSTAYDVVAILPGYVPIRIENTSWAATTSVNLNQQIDRNFSNP
jgi:hypothetical protein